MANRRARVPRTSRSSRTPRAARPLPDTPVQNPAAAPTGLPSRPTPVWAVQLFTFLNSTGTALVTNGIFYITDSGFGFTRTQNFHLAFWMGITYILSAYTTTPVVGWLRRTWGVSTRGVLLALMVALGVLSLAPLTLARLPMDEHARRGVQIAGIWTTVILYNTLTGVLWPIVESYIAGGRRGQDLVRTMGAWNVCWCSAAIPATLISAPLVKSAPNAAIAGMAGVHAVCAALLLFHTKEPVPHVDEHEPHPPVYERLLLAFRMLMPMGYMVLTTLTPMLGTMFHAQGVSDVWRPIFGFGWIVPRVLSFGLFGFWGGWHGRWWAAVFGGVMIVVGFGIAVLSPLLPAMVLPCMLTGLACFGLGMAAVYTGAIYYAMEVHKSDVDAGGAHETLVGVGYTAGPICGLASTGILRAGGLPEGHFGTILFGIVGVLAVWWTLVVIRKVRAMARAGH